MSLDQLHFLYKSALPQLFEQLSLVEEEVHLVDVGSRLGAVLYAVQ